MFLSFVIIFFWEVIYAHFYNWDCPLDFVLVMYDLIELIIEALLWTKNYSTFDTHTQHTRLCSDNVYLIYVIVHVQMWYVCLSTYWSNPKRFLSVLYVLKVSLYFYDFSFCSKCIFVFFFKNWFRGLFARSSQLRASREMCLREISKVTFSYRKSSYCLASISWLNPSREMVFRLKLEISKFHIEAIATGSQLRASRVSFSMSHDCFATL